MYTVLSGLTACGRLGLAAAAGVCGQCHATVARVARWRDANRPRQSSVSSDRRRTRLNLSV